jgi:hypothetical protein
VGGGHSVHDLHDTAGWVALAGSLLITAGVGCHWAGWRWPTLSPLPGRVSPPYSSMPSWFAFAVLWLAVNEGVTRWWFADGASSQTSVPRWTASMPENLGSFVREPLLELSAEILRPDVYRAGRWKGGDDLVFASYYIEWNQGQVARYLPFAHNPTVCLPLAGCELVASLGEFRVAWHGTHIPFQVYKFSRMGEDMWVAFTIWDPSRGAPMKGATGGNTLFRTLRERWLEVVDKRENQPAQMLTLAISGSSKDHSVLMEHTIEDMIVEWN